MEPRESAPQNDLGTSWWEIVLDRCHKKAPWWERTSYSAAFWAIWWSFKLFIFPAAQTPSTTLFMRDRFEQDQIPGPTRDPVPGGRVDVDNPLPVHQHVAYKL